MDLQHLISNAQHMPNIPRVVQELIQSFGDENVTGDDIAKKLNQDQAMTAKVLRMANSSKYGGHRQVGSINDAVVLLGFNALRTMVLASGLSTAFPKPEGFDIEGFWLKSFTMGAICKWVAKYAPDVDPEIAFTCGMIHDIGGLLTHILVSDQAQEIQRVVEQGANRVEMENERLGFNFTDAGAELACRWKFPQEIVDGIRYQLEPQVSEDDYKSLAGIICIAKYIYESKEDHQACIENFPAEHAKALKLDRVALLNSLDDIDSIDSEMDEVIH